MANFTTETKVRDQFQLTDTTRVPPGLVTGSIDDAHVLLLRFLDPVYDVPSPDAAVILGETFLAGSHLLRTLAFQDAFEQKRVSVGGQRLEAGSRFDALTESSRTAEDKAWETLEPYLKIHAARRLVDVTDTTEVLGKD